MIAVQGARFVDDLGRTVLLRGVNLGGSSKVPRRPDGATYRREGFYEHRQVSFVDRPFPIADADGHFSRLREWGFELLRLLVCWEAVEHAGPGRYDEEYLEYLRRLVAKAAGHGLAVLVDPHQDVWSRWSGGDGAPGWTLEAAGFDLPSLARSGAAVLHQEHGDPFPWLTWPTNSTKLAAATMFTLFFGGNDFAPRTRVDGEPVQEYLQGHYVRAFQEVARALAGLDNVVGYGVMNEPSPGFIGVQDVRGRPGAALLLQESPTVLQSMALGAGVPQVVDVLGLGLFGARLRGRRLLNADRCRAWRADAADLWQENGVWRVGPDDAPATLRPGHFALPGGRGVAFARDYLRPFANRFASAIRTIAPRAIVFVEGVPLDAPLPWGPADAVAVVHAPHWYDGVTMATRRFHRLLSWDRQASRPVLGGRAVRRQLAREIGALMAQARVQMPGIPTLIAEVGIPFDLARGRAYRTGDFSAQVRALDASMQALERNAASHAIWNYTADNTNEHGDQWNGEDFSIYSADQERAGVERALAAVARPWPRRIAGQPLSVSFSLRSRRFTLRFRAEASATGPTEIFLPSRQFGRQVAVAVSDGEWEYRDGLLVYRHSSELAEHTVTIRPRQAPESRRRLS